jgi:hypothetical protein
VAYLRTMLRRVDSSLIDEWEGLQVVARAARAGEAEAPRPRDLGDDPKALAARIRSELHRLVKALADEDYEEAARSVDSTGGEAWTPKRFEQALTEFYAEYGAIRADRQARAPQFTQIERVGPRAWTARQILVDANDDNLWVLECAVDLDRPRDPSLPLIELRRIGV